MGKGRKGLQKSAVACVSSRKEDGEAVLCPPRLSSHHFIPALLSMDKSIMSDSRLQRFRWDCNPTPRGIHDNMRRGSSQLGPDVSPSVGRGSFFVRQTNASDRAGAEILTVVENLQ